MEIKEAQVFNENGDIMTLEKCKLSCHQESVQKSKDPKLRSYVVLNACCFVKTLMPIVNHHEATTSKGCAKKMKDLKTMHDESLMFVYKDFGASTCTIKKFATSMKLLDGHMNKA